MNFFRSVLYHVRFEHVHLNYPAKASQTVIAVEPNFVSGILCHILGGLFTRVGKILTASFSRKILR